ncbi:hypothetical protein D3C87_459760 [compost metagenome]
MSVSKIKLTNAMADRTILSGFSLNDIEEMVSENPSLRGYLQGYLAEKVLRKKLEELPGVTSVTKIPDSASEKGDFKVIYKGTPITIEVKSLATNSVKEDILTQTWQGTVRIKNTDKREIEVDGIGTVSSSKLFKGQFDILAVCCFAVSGQWDFVFMENKYIPEDSEMPGLLKTSFVINPATTACLTEDLLKVLESTYSSKPSVTN